MPEEKFTCPRCGSNRFVSISRDEGLTRVPQCVPCGHIHPGYYGFGWQSAGWNDEWIARGDPS